MFTGIIEEIGKISAIKKGEKSSVLSIEADLVIKDMKLGDSIAVDGVCLTATSKKEDGFTVDAINQTLARSALENFEVGRLVNLERALTPSSRMGGHIVSGHVDFVSTIRRIAREDIADLFEFTIPASYMKYIVLQGSICINGISLTIHDIKQDSFCASIIPFTQKETNLQYKKEGHSVNVEVDMLAKFTERLLTAENEKKPAITIDFLRQNGF